MDILIIEEYPLIRKGLIFIFKESVMESNIIEVSNLKEIEAIKLKNLGLITINAEKEPFETLEFVKRVKADNPKVKIIVLGSDINSVEGNIFDSMVDGHILKNSNVNEISYGINNILKGGKYFNNNSRGTPDEINLLSKREKEVLGYLLLGITNSQIAKKMFIEEITVKKHVSNILMKFDLKRRTEIVLYVRGKIDNKIA